MTILFHWLINIPIVPSRNKKDTRKRFYILRTNVQSYSALSPLRVLPCVLLFTNNKQIEKVPRDVRSAYSGKKRQVREKDGSQQIEHTSMQIKNGTGPGVQRSELPLSACHFHNSVKGRVR